MHWDVIEVRPEREWTLWIRFADGVSGRLKLEFDELTGVLAPLRDPEFFERAFIDQGAVAWPGEIDLAPDAMYEAIQQSRTGDAVTLRP
ncbi:MAG TPA: DUF2442 domain-containing protein [Bryobacteraceae bacterium]|jgi:hypothetical protein